MSGSKTGVSLKSVTKRFGKVTAVDGVSIDIQPGEFFSLLGPSGCGKTTLLRLIAGFETATSGHIFIGNQNVTKTPPRTRPTAMVFQNYALFPNMTVSENVGYGLRVQKVDKANRERRVAEALERVHLQGYEGRPVTQLSGGQQQRVALARALAVEPQVILFDEPLSNLDVALREHTRRELKELHQQLGTTSIYVTHDQQEALALSDRIAVMQSGRLMQVDTPETLYHTPKTAFVAGFLGGSNIVESVALAEQLAGEKPPANHVLAIRPEKLILTKAGTPNAVPAHLVSRQFLGLHTEWWVTTNGETLRLWTEPATTIPETLYIQTTQHRWVQRNPE